MTFPVSRSPVPFSVSSAMSSAPLGHEKPLQVAAPSIIEKINEDLYMARRDPDLTFVLSRLTDNNVAIWWRLHGKHGSARGSEVIAELWDESCERWTENQKRFFLREIEAGAMAFRHTLEMHEASQKKEIRPEIWISYVLSGLQVNPSEPIHEGLFPHLEMAMTALTHPNVPVVLHMGIGRTPHHTKSFYNGLLPQHKGLSHPLHSFTAKAIQSTPQGDDKLWMMTRPTWDMAAILDRSLPKEAIHKGGKKSVICRKDGSMAIKNREGEVVSFLSKEDCERGKTDFFKHPEMFQPLDEYVVEYRALADSF